MSRAILLTGFNNWGKTTIIYELFKRKYFRKNKSYSIEHVHASFVVESHSNDDMKEERYIKTISDKVFQHPAIHQDLFCAFCPTRESHNDSKRILSTNLFLKFDEVHIVLLKYKWDFHAELREQEIQEYLSKLSNVHFFIVEADSAHTSDQARFAAKTQQIRSYLQSIYLRTK